MAILETAEWSNFFFFCIQYMYQNRDLPNPSLKQARENYLKPLLHAEFDVQLLKIVHELNLYQSMV